MLYKWTAQDIPWGIKIVTATIAAAWTTITTAADADVVGWKVIWIVEVGDSDAIVKSVVLASDGKVTVTTATAQTAECEYSVSIARATGNDA